MFAAEAKQICSKPLKGVVVSTEELQNQPAEIQKSNTPLGTFEVQTEDIKVKPTSNNVTDNQFGIIEQHEIRKAIEHKIFGRGINSF